MADRFDEMAGRVQLDCESYVMRASIDGRRRVIADALRAAHARGVEEGETGLRTALAAERVRVERVREAYAAVPTQCDSGDMMRFLDAVHDILEERALDGEP